LKDSSLGSHLPLVGSAHGAELALYPGTVLLLLAYFGLAGVRRPQLRTVLALGAVALVASLLADGLGLHLFGIGWYALLRDHVPGFARIRSPYRFAVLTQIGIALLAGFGLDALRRWSRQWGALLAIALSVIAIVEVVQVPLATTPAIPGHNSDWVAYLAAHPRGPVAMVPFPSGPTSVDYADTTTAMLLGLQHGHPLVNGYSGFFPARAIDLRHVMDDFPSAASLVALHDLGVEWIVVDNDWLSATRRAQLAALGVAAPVFAGRDRTVYGMPATVPSVVP
jgi:hypothetical protein